MPIGARISSIIRKDRKKEYLVQQKSTHRRMDEYEKAFEVSEKRLEGAIRVMITVF